MSLSWTTADYEDLCWHDCHVHGFHLGEIHDEWGTAELVLDIDFIVEWLTEKSGTFTFRIAPATLTFHDVSGLRIELDYATPTAGMTPFSIDGIIREPRHNPTIELPSRWRIPINWPSGEITFISPGFTQVLRREPIETERQNLTARERLV